jgi:hypothetical protein
MGLLRRSQCDDSFVRNHISFDFSPENQEPISLHVFVDVKIKHEAPGDIFDDIHVALENHGSPLIVSGDVSMRLHATNQMDQTGR